MTIKKTDFTEQEIKGILNHLIKAYLDDDSNSLKMTFDEMIRGTAKDLRISEEQIRIAFSHPSAAKVVTDLELSHNKLLQSNRNLMDHLKKPFAYKVGFEFTQQEAKDVWLYTQSEYLGKKEYELKKFDDTIKAVANDLGLTPKQVRAAISKPDKATFRELERTHNKRVKLHFHAVKWVESAGYPRIVKVLKLSALWKWILRKKSQST